MNKLIFVCGLIVVCICITYAQSDSAISKINTVVSKLDSIVSKVETSVSKVEAIASSLKNSDKKNDTTKVNIDSSIAKLRMNYAVPDAPAFKALDIQPDNIMRPSTTQELALILANQTINPGLPSAFALEFSPYLAIAGESLTLNQYQKSLLTNILYHTRLSVATKRSSSTGDTTKVSFGIRFTLIDKSDLRLDKTYISKVYSVNDSFVKIESRIRDHFRGPSPVFIRLTQAQQDSINALANDSIKIAEKALEDSITAYRENAIKKNWNKPIVELGVATVGYSLDSTSIKSIVEDQVAGWLVAAGNIQQWGQWVIGANGALRRNSDGKMAASEGSLGGRIYAGSNATKGFIDIDWKGKQSSHPKYLFQTGSELRVYKIFWVTLSAGLVSLSDGGSKFTSNADIRIGTP